MIHGSFVPYLPNCNIFEYWFVFRFHFRFNFRQFSSPITLWYGNTVVFLFTLNWLIFAHPQIDRFQVISGVPKMTGSNRKQWMMWSAKPVKGTFWTRGKATLHTFGILTVNTDRCLASFFASWSTMIVMPHTSYKKSYSPKWTYQSRLTPTRFHTRPWPGPWK